MNKNNYNFSLAALLLVVLLFLNYFWRFPEYQIKNEMSYSEFLENVEIDNIKSQIFIECTVIIFDIKNTNVNLKTQRKQYDKVNFSSKINPVNMAKFIKNMMDRGYKLEFLEPTWRKKHSIFSIYDYMRFSGLIAFLVYVFIIVKKKKKKLNDL